MLRNLTSAKKFFIKEIRLNTISYVILFVVLLASLFIRVYRTQALLGFYYDQGRDALVVWDLWHEGKPFLIGPVTGLRGIFLGPFYYYLIAPFYLIGKGNPVYPAVFLAFVSCVAILFLYIASTKIHSRTAGLIAATIAAFSYKIFTHSRWLSNPNPILLTSVIFFWSLWEIENNNKDLKIKGQKINFWGIVEALMVGLSLQLEAASAFFYILVIFIFFIWHYTNRCRTFSLKGLVAILKEIRDDKLTLLVSFFVIVLTLVPQIAFNFRHDNILLNNFKDLFFEEKAFRGLTKFVLEERTKYFWRVFSTLFFDGRERFATLFITISFSMLIASFNKFKDKVLPLFTIFILPPVVGYYLFQGNYGNIYDYYMSGYYMIFILLFSIGMAELWRKKLGFLIFLAFFYHFFSLNKVLIGNYLTATPATRPIALEDEIAAVDFIYNDAKVEREPFNVDVYVPPVIPYSYNYLLVWRGKIICGDDLCGMVEEEKDVVYTISEPETIHLDRWENWSKRYEDTTSLEVVEKFGQVMVQKRRRI